MDGRSGRSPLGNVGQNAALTAIIFPSMSSTSITPPNPANEEFENALSGSFE